MVYLRKNRKGNPYLWILPSFICMSIIQFFPGILSIFMSFTKLDVSYVRRPFEAPFAGLGNYGRILQPGTSLGNSFLTSLMITIGFTLASTILGYLIGLFEAMLLNQPFKGRSVVRAVFLIPWIVPTVVSAFCWRMIFLRDYGILNKLLISLHIIEEPIFWMIGSNAFLVIVVARVWASCPFIMISILAALQTIPVEQYEAARVDGASAWQQFRYITMPGISAVSKVVVLLQFIWGSGEFTIPYAIFNQTPPKEANLISVLVYSNTFSTWDFGGGAAVSTIVLCIMLVLSIFYMRAAMRPSTED